MKLSVLALCVVYLTLLLGCAVSCKQKLALPALSPAPVVSPIQRKAAHSIGFLDKQGREQGMCSATAIGPHALLLATHCDEHAKFLSVNIDLSTREYHILAGAVDDRDHLIIFLDGPEFRNIVPVIQRQPAIGEKIYAYGFGGNVYPSHRYDGMVIAERGGGDDSDVDADAALANYSFPAIPGDSGAAVYGTDGAIVGVITYGRPGVRPYSTGFALNFPQEVLDKAATLK